MITRRCLLLLHLLLFAGLVAATTGLAAESGPTRWASQIEALEAKNRQKPPPKDGLLFVGSSSVRGWDLAKHFPDLPVINQGFGGSQMADSVYYAQRIILPYRPRVVIVYAGDNDVSAGKSPQQVMEDYKKLVAKIHGDLPTTKVVFLAIKPSLKRWALVEKMRDANRLVLEETTKDDRLTFVDIDTPMIGADGRPRPELFADDGLHLNERGYRLWSELLLPHLR